MKPLLHVVLHQPEIPNNTGNIGRTCVATGCALHLIHPVAFDLDEKACRRAGLDYWPRLDVREHASFEAYRRTLGADESRVWLLTTRAPRPVFDARFEPGDHVLLGGESRGLPADVLAWGGDRCVSLPLMPGERSLNVATAACTVVYEAVRQFLDGGRIGLDEGGRLRPPDGISVWSSNPAPDAS